MSEPDPTSRPQTAHPSDLVAIILGSETLSLEGFETPVTPTRWMLPGHAMPIISGSPDDGLEAIVARNKRKRLFAVVTTVAISITTFFLGMVVNDGQLAIAGAPTKAAASAWKVAAIRDDGVAMDIEGRQVIFKVGDTMPSGEVLQDTDAANGRYRTDRSVVSLRSLTPPAPAAASTPAPSTAAR